MGKLNKLINNISEIAYRNEQQYGGCSQCVISGFKEVFCSKIHDDVFKAATGFAGGIGLTGNTCGALTGGVMVLSIFLGREYNNFADTKKVRFKSYKLSKKLTDRFEEEYGSTICYNIQRKIMGKAYNTWDKQQYNEFLKAGGHDDKCPSVCANAAKWIMEILLEEGLLKEENK